METIKPVQQAFGSPGGKSYLAPRIAAIIPPHKTYVEPFAGGAAVYFRKEPSQKEVLSDKDKEIAFAFRFIRDMTEAQWDRLKRMNWRYSRTQFSRVKQLIPKNDVDRFYKFYYLRKAGFGSGAKSYGAQNETRNHGYINIDRLLQVRERLKRTAIHNNDATGLIDRYDNPTTFFYLDPPYPNRAFIGRTFKTWGEEDLKKLVAKLQHIKGKFALSLGTEHIKFIPKNWHISRVKVWRRIPAGESEFNQTYQYEIIATNYDPRRELAKPSIPMALAKVEHLKAPHNGHKRMPVGVFSDKRGERLSRRYHRGWKRVSLLAN